MIKSKNEFNLYLENLKVQEGFDTYTETVVHYIEHESDHEVEQIARHLNKKIKEEIGKEAMSNGMLLDQLETVSLV